MHESDHRLIEYSGILRDWVLPTFEKFAWGNSFRALVMRRRAWEAIYDTLLTAEVLWWLELGRAFGFFPDQSTKNLQERHTKKIRPKLIQLAPTPMSVEQAMRSPLTLLRDRLPGWAGYFPHDKNIPVNNSRRWLPFRSELLLARSFGRNRSTHMFLSTLQFSRLPWSEVLAACRSRDSLAGAAAAGEVGFTLTSPLPEFDADVFIAGFMSTIDHLASAETLRGHGDDSEFPSVRNRVTFIRRCRLDLSDLETYDRFLQLAHVVGRLLEAEERVGISSDKARSANAFTAIAYSARVQQLADS